MSVALGCESRGSRRLAQVLGISRDQVNVRSLLNAKTLRFVLITIVLGAVGSGVWEWLLKPFAMGASEVGLSIATLGVKAFKDSLYQEIALGLREESSLRLYFLFFGFAPAAAIALVSGFFAGAKAARVEPTSGKQSGLDRFLLSLFKPSLFLSFLMAAFFIIQANQLAYTNRAITHFNQLLAIAGPALSEKDQLTLKSNFAQIASGEDYERLVTQLESICKEKGFKVPTFSVW